MDVAEVLEAKAKLEPLLDQEFDYLAVVGLTPSGLLRVDLHRKDILARTAGILSNAGIDADVCVMDYERADPSLSRAYNSGLLNLPMSSWYAKVCRENPNINGISYNPLRVRITVQNLQKFYDEPHLHQSISDTLILTLTTGEQVALPVVIAECKL